MSNITALANDEFKIQISLTYPKNDQDRNEDCFNVSKRKRTFALSDGASVSFASSNWSEILVRSYCSNSSVGTVWLNKAIAEFNDLFDRESLPWMQQAAFDQGTFATLLGLRFYAEQNQVQVFAVGDTTAVLCDGEEILESFPYSAASEFNNSPELLSTVVQHNAFVDKDNFHETAFRDWHFGKLKSPSIFCMTDALAHWFLSQRESGDNPITKLRQLTKQHHFSKFVEEERAAGRLKRDDTSLLAFW